MKTLLLFTIALIFGLVATSSYALAQVKLITPTPTKAIETVTPTAIPKTGETQKVRAKGMIAPDEETSAKSILDEFGYIDDPNNRATVILNTSTRKITFIFPTPLTEEQKINFESWKAQKGLE